MAKENLGGQSEPQPHTYIVQASAITSRETYLYPDGSRENVLRGLYLDVKRGECWGIIGDEPFEMELLMQIIGNVRPYGSGRCVLVERGMMRQKRRILPHVFYISGGDTVPGNLNTLEYLMFVTAHFGMPDAQRQAAILEMLLNTELYYLTLVPMKYLTAGERAVVSLLAAALSRALLVIFSVAELTFDARVFAGVRHVADIIAARGGALLIGTRDCDLAQAACDHAAFLINGRFSQRDAMEPLLNLLDRRAFILTVSEPERLAGIIRNANPALDALVFDNEVHVYTRGDATLDEAEMMRLLIAAGETVETLQVSRPTLKNAYREVLAGHAL